MATWTIRLPDDFVESLTEHPLPLPVDDYCLRALREAFERAEERRQHDAALLAQIEAAAPHGGPPVLYDYKEAAELLRCSIDTIERKVKAGDIPTVRLGTRPLIPAQAIDVIINAALEQEPKLSDKPRRVRRR